MKKLSFVVVALSSFVSVSAHADINIGVSMSRFDDNFLTDLRRSLQSYSDTMDEVSIQVSDAQGSIGRQQSQIQNFIANDVDAIITMLVDADSGVTFSRIADESDVPLVFVNMLPSNMEDFPDKQAWVGSNEYQAGELQATYICEQLNGKGDAVILMGQLGTTGQRGRTAAVRDVLDTDECNNINILGEQTAEWMRTPAMDVMSNWVSSGVVPDAVFANNDEMAIGAIMAMKSAGISMDDVVVGGVDGTQDGLFMLGSGDLDVTVFQNATGQAQGSLDTALKIVRGQEFESRVEIPFEIVTLDNVDNFK
ncbi:substrate-binding domain-containing protein [Halomonas salipaludis]|uniref:Rhizopine-binding protein n=1 Tax=Halomonas salipaludis TaxID=2032625 RepID=A0A2A2ENP6_9GAMM|nr:substrate-binding domain-containing protein [Halomonas salipaludis]PAU74104.1 rhizopine-binding protein [Halomonas salipaludis]